VLSSTKATTEKHKLNMTENTKEKNGVVLSPTVCSIVRGEAKGQTYPAFIPTKETLSDYITFFGADKVIDILSRAAKADAQAALDYVLGDNGWQKRTVVGEDGKESTQLFYDESQLDVQKLLDTIVSGTVRGGVTKAQLEEEREELLAQLQRIYRDASSNANLSTEEKARMFSEGLAIAPKIQELEAAIEAKSRAGRRSKDEVAASK